MTLAALIWAVPSLAALVAGVLVWYYRRKLKATEESLKGKEQENGDLRTVLAVERKISASRKQRADALNEALLARQKEEHDADARTSSDDLLSRLRGKN